LHWPFDEQERLYSAGERKMPKSVETASDRFVPHEGHLWRLLIFLQQAKAFAPVRAPSNLSLSLVGALED